MPNPTYDEIFQRNIGIFTPEEQEKIKNLRIAIIGVGGIGAPVAESLARLGIGELRLVEPDTFEVSNLNRQTGAFLNTLGRNKADVMADIARQINPEIELRVITQKLFGDELKQLIVGCDIIVDGIDYFNIDDTIELHNFAKDLKIPLVTSAACFSILSFSFFNPEKAMMSDFITADEYVEKIKQVTDLLFPVYPEELTQEIMDNMLRNYLTGQNYSEIPSYSANAPFGVAILTKFIIDILVITENKKSIPDMPDMLYVDTKNLEIKRVYR